MKEFPDHNNHAVERFDSVVARTGLSRRQLYRKLARGEFPAPIELGANSVGFYTQEIDAWLASRPRVSYATPEPEAA